MPCCCSQLTTAIYVPAPCISRITLYFYSHVAKLPHVRMGDVSDYSINEKPVLARHSDYNIDEKPVLAGHSDYNINEKPVLARHSDYNINEKPVLASHSDYNKKKNR